MRLLQYDRRQLQLIYDLLSSPLTVWALLAELDPHSLKNHLTMTFGTRQAWRLADKALALVTAADDLSTRRAIVQTKTALVLTARRIDSLQDPTSFSARSCTDQLRCAVAGIDQIRRYSRILELRELRKEIGHLLVEFDLWCRSCIVAKEILDADRHDRVELLIKRALITTRRESDRFLGPLLHLAIQQNSVMSLLRSLRLSLNLAWKRSPDEIEKADSYIEVSSWESDLTRRCTASARNANVHTAKDTVELHSHLTSALPFRWLWLEMMAGLDAYQCFDFQISRGLADSWWDPDATVPAPWKVSELIALAHEAHWLLFGSAHGIAAQRSQATRAVSARSRALELQKRMLSKAPIAGQTVLRPSVGNLTTWRNCLEALDITKSTVDHLSFVYAVARSSVKRAITIQRLVGGLEAFSQHYSLYTRYKSKAQRHQRSHRGSKASPSSRQGSGQRWRFAYARWVAHSLRSYSESGTSGVELRLSLENRKDDSLEVLRSIRVGRDLAEGTKNIDLGLIIHAMRQRSSSQRAAHDEISKNAVRDAQRLIDWKLKKQGSIGGLLVGFDVAGPESHSSVSQFVDAYSLIDKHNRLGGTRIGKTYHVGEDRSSIVGELHSVAEAVIKLGLNQGDRVGHGTAIGLDPQLQRFHGEPERISRLERLLNLLGDWRLVTKHDVPLYLQPERREQYLSDLEREIRRCHGETIDYALIDALADGILDDPKFPQLVGVSLTEQLPHTEEDLTSEELLRTQIRQAYVTKLLRDRAITVEICPTSNIIVRKLPDYSYHPLFYLITLDINVALCTDNSGLLSVSIADEFHRILKPAVLRLATARVEKRLHSLVRFGKKAARDTNNQCWLSRFGLPSTEDQVRMALKILRDPREVADKICRTAQSASFIS